MSYTRIVTTYETITQQGRKNLPCPVCGKKVRRQRTFEMTLNPWNKNPETGQPRTRAEIRAELLKKAHEWEQIPEEHAAHAEGRKL